MRKCVTKDRTGSLELFLKPEGTIAQTEYQTLTLHRHANISFMCYNCSVLHKDNSRIVTELTTMN